MGQAIAAIGSALAPVAGAIKSNIGTIIPGALTGFGFLNNLFNQQKRNRLYNLETNPQALARYEQGLTRPLVAGEVKAAENEAQANLGERGLSLSPAQAAQVYSQTLSPLYERQSAQAAQLAEEMLRSAGGTIAPPTDVSGPLADLMKAIQQRQGGATPSSTQTTVGADPNTGIGSMPAGSEPPFWSLPDSPDIFGIPSSGFGNVPDWSTILGSVSPSVPSFEMPTIGGGLGS